MADYVMIFPGIGSTGRARKTERRNIKHTAAAFRTWYTGSSGITQRRYESSFRVIADPSTGTYERMY